MTNFDKAQREGYKIEKYGDYSDWFVVDNFGICWGHYDTERKAVNAMNRIGKGYN